MLNISGTNEDILIKLSVDLFHDVVVKCWCVHGPGNLWMVATPTLLRTVLLSNPLLKPWQKTNFFQNFFQCFYVKLEYIQHFYNCNIKSKVNRNRYDINYFSGDSWPMFLWNFDVLIFFKSMHQLTDYSAPW